MNKHFRTEEYCPDYQLLFRLFYYLFACKMSDEENKYVFGADLNNEAEYPNDDRKVLFTDLPS